MWGFAILWGWLTSLPSLAIFCLALGVTAFSVMLANGIREWWLRGHSQFRTFTPSQSKEQIMSESPYLKIRGTGGHTYFEANSKGPHIISLAIIYELSHKDQQLKAVTGMTADLTYYSPQWQRLFESIRGGWISTRGNLIAERLYLETGLITFGSHEVHDLAIAVKSHTNANFFALGEESLPFYLWGNPSFKLPREYNLRILLKGNSVQKTFHYHIKHTDGGEVEDFGEIQPPEGMS